MLWVGPSGPASAIPCTWEMQKSRCCWSHLQSGDLSRTDVNILGSSFLQGLLSSGFAQSPEGRHLYFPFILLSLQSLCKLEVHQGRLVSELSVGLLETRRWILSKPARNSPRHFWPFLGILWHWRRYHWSSRGKEKCPHRNVAVATTGRQL